jgi:hypothetical protein
MTPKPKTRKAPAAKPAGINPKLTALAAKIDKAEAELERTLTEVLAPAERNAWNNPEDEAAQAALAEAEIAESATCDASMALTKKLSEIVATNLNELSLKARYADTDDRVEESIIRDLLALDRKPRAARALTRMGEEAA